MTSRTYPLPDPAAVAAKIAAAGGPRIDPHQPTGTATADGVTLSWSIADGQITISIVHKPWIISEGTVWSHVDAVLA